MELCRIRATVVKTLHQGQIGANSIATDKLLSRTENSWLKGLIPFFQRLP